MKTKFEDTISEDERKMVRRWTIGASAFYGVVLLGMAGLIAAGVLSDGTGNQASVYYNLDGFALTTTAQASPDDMSTSHTNGLSISEISVTAPIPQPDPQMDKFAADMFSSPTTYSTAAPAQAPAAAARGPVPVPEVDELEPPVEATAETSVSPPPAPDKEPQQTASHN